MQKINCFKTNWPLSTYRAPIRNIYHSSLTGSMKGTTKFFHVESFFVFLSLSRVLVPSTHHALIKKKKKKKNIRIQKQESRT